MRKHGKTSFNPGWLLEVHFKDWLRENKNDKYSAHCHKSDKTFSLSNMGRQALTSHMRGAKHKEQTKLSNINNFLAKPVNSTNSSV